MKGSMHILRVGWSKLSDRLTIKHVGQGDPTLIPDHELW